MIKNPTNFNAGKYTITASNGIGNPSSASTNIIIYPILPTITLTSEKSIVEPDSEAILTCKVEGIDGFQ